MTTDTFERLAREQADSLKAQTEELFFSVIMEHLGPGTEIRSLVGRINLVIHHDGTEVLQIDGENVIALSKIETEIADNGPNVTFKATRKVKWLKTDKADNL